MVLKSTFKKKKTGIISGVFAMSGGPLSAFAVDPEPKNTYTNMTTLLGCDQSTPLETVRCLQTLPLQTLISSDFKYHVCELFRKVNVIVNVFILYLLYRIQNYSKKASWQE